MRRELCPGVAAEVGAGHGSDERLTPREELPELQAELVARARTYAVKRFSPVAASTLLGPPSGCLEATLVGSSSPQR